MSKIEGEINQGTEIQRYRWEWSDRLINIEIEKERER